MKKLLTLVLTAVLFGAFGESFEDELSRVENWINATYRSSPRAHKFATDKLDKICASEQSEQEKIAELRKQFPKAFPTVEKENLIVTEPIAWEIGSLKLGYDIQEGTATEAKTGDIVKDLTQIETSRGKNRIENTTSIETGGFGAQGEATANVGIKGSRGFDWGIGASGSISGRYEKNSTDREENGAAWNKKNQRMFQRNREIILSMINQMAIKNLHLTFTVKLYNRTGSDIIFDLTTASIPVYMGKQSCNNPAKPFRVTDRELVLRSNNPAGQDIVFRMELDTTSARELVDFMTKDTPRIAFEEGPIKIVNSSGVNLLTERNILLAKSSPVILTGPSEKLSWWICQFHASNAKVTIGEACDAVSQDVKNYKDPLFAKDEKSGLTSVSGVPFGKFKIQDDSGEIAFFEYQGVFYSKVSADLLGKTIENGGFTIHVVNGTDLNKIQNAKLIQMIIEQYRQIEENEKFKSILSYQIALYFQRVLNIPEHLKWLQESSQLSNPIACYLLGNNTKSISLYRKAAELGHVGSQVKLGLCYFNGKGIPLNYEEAAKWFRAAAKQGHAEAQYRLGECYYGGQGVPLNYEEAAKWFRAAAKQGHVAAQNRLAECYYSGKVVSWDYEEAAKWFRVAAKQGHAEAQCRLGECYYDGKGVPLDYEEAVKWFRAAAKQEHAAAQNYLGMCYLNGKGVEKNKENAFRWCLEAAKKGNVTAQYNIGIFYYYGTGTVKNKDKAKEWLMKALDQGNSDAKKMLMDQQYW